MNSRNCQNTLKKEVSFSGIGLHTGVMVDMTFRRAPPNTGIVFERVDLPTRPQVPAQVEYVVDTSRSTTLGKEGVVVHTVEHVLAAFAAMGVDNAFVQINNLEPPIGNGGSDLFVEMIEKAGLEEQPFPRKTLTIKQPLYYEDKEISLVALPCSGFKISYTLNYPGVKQLETQYHSTLITKETFKQEIAPCRTFALYQEISYLMDAGLIKGGSLSNAVVVCDKAVLSKGGLVFKNEMARHKILDMVGDLFLAGFLCGHIISIRSGHASNVAFAKIIKNSFKD